jgi:hypothetical protein
MKGGEYVATVGKSKPRFSFLRPYPHEGAHSTKRVLVDEQTPWVLGISKILL